MSLSQRTGNGGGNAVEILVGVNVVDEALYGQYREHMAPLLLAHGGSFRLDARVAEVLRSPAEQPFNRLFTIRFPSRERLDAFFSSPEYLAVRKRFFEPSVSAVTRLASFEVSEDP